MSPVMFASKRIYYLIHILVWTTLFILPTYLMYVESSHDTVFLQRTYLQAILYAIVFYVNFTYFVPRFFFRKKQRLYVILVVVLVTGLTLVEGLADRYIFHRGERKPAKEMLKPDVAPNFSEKLAPQAPPGAEVPFKAKPQPPAETRPGSPSKNWPTYNFLLISFLVAGLGLGLRIAERLIEQEKQQKEAEKDKLRTELAFLKNQINPHFFFNTLNNIYSLIATIPADGQKAVLQLSRLMRYLLYETEQDDTDLSREVAFMTNYIDLMKLRLSDKIDLQVNFPDNHADLTIPPLIFLPFIENAFKHGISYRNPSFIHVSMAVEGNLVRFECRNSIIPKIEEKNGNGERKSSGIGLENVKKRLALLFPEKHRLEIRKSDAEFYVILELDVSEVPVI
jgi:two-component system, LytTR family, sensor kinase